MRQRLFIIGNSGAARECYWLFDSMLKADSALQDAVEFAGFLAWEHYPPHLASLSQWDKGDADDYRIADSDLFVIGVGQPQLRQAIFDRMKARDAKFFTLVHPLAEVSPAARIGEANIFQRNSTVFCDAVVGNANYFNGAANASHDAVVGDCNFLGPFSLLLGNVRIGSRNLVGTHCTVLPNTIMGDDNILAPGSVLYKGCGNNCRMLGNPALKVGEVEEQLHN